MSSIQTLRVLVTLLVVPPPSPKINLKRTLAGAAQRDSFGQEGMSYSSDNPSLYVNTNHFPVAVAATLPEPHSSKVKSFTFLISSFHNQIENGIA